MSDPIKLNTIISFHVAVFIAFLWFSLADFAATEITEHTKFFAEQDEGNFIIKQTKKNYINIED